MFRSFLLLLLSLSSAYGQVLEIPFSLRNDIILLDVYVGESRQANTFIFDTGASTDVIDIGVANALGITADQRQQVNGAGGTEYYDIATDQSYNLENTVRVDNTYFVFVDLFNLRAKLERNFDGIIGYSLLKNYVTRIDYQNKRMSLYHSIEELDTTGYKAIAFGMDNGVPIPQFDISITLNNGQTYTDKVFFDSGAALTLVVNTPFGKKHSLTKKAGKTLIFETQNLDSRSVSEQIAINNMNIAGYDLGEMVIAVANDKKGVNSYKGYLGILGAEVISRFDVILDYTTSTLYIKPNAAYSEAFDFPLSGISLKKDDGHIVVRYVQKETQAYQKGIKKGDRLLAIDGNSDADIDAFRELLKQEGKTCTLELEGLDGERRLVSITLKRLL